MVKILIFLAGLVLVSAYPSEGDFPVEILEDQQGQQYYLLPVENQPLVRNRRQLNGGVGSSGVDLSYKGNLANTPSHKVDGTVFGERSHNGLLSGGGRVDYLHKPSQSTASLQAQAHRGLGTTVTAQGQYNIYQSPNGRSTLGATGQYSRHFGGPGGTGKPNYGAFLNFNHRF